MATMPTPVAELLDAGARRGAHRRRRHGSSGHLPAHPAVGRRARLHDLVDPVQPQARAHRREREGGRLDHRPDQRRRPDRPSHDPGRRPGHRRRSARRLGAAAADLVGQGAGDRRVPQGAGGAAAVLRAGAHRDHAAPRPVLVRRRRAGARRRSRPSARRPRDALDTASSMPRTGLEKLATYPYQIATWVDDAGYPVASPSRRRSTRRSRRRHVRAAGRPGRPDRSRGLADRLAHPAAARLRLRRAAARDGLGPRVAGVRRSARVTLIGRSAPGAGTRPRSRSSSTRSGRCRSRGSYFDALSAERGTPVKPRLSFGFLALRTTRLPFLTATIIPVVLGILIAASHGSFDLVAAALTVDRRGVRPARAQRRERRVRHRPGRRRRERHADQVQRRLAGHPVRARVAPPDGDPRDRVLRPRRR